MKTVAGTVPWAAIKRCKLEVDLGNISGKLQTEELEEEEDCITETIFVRKC